MDAPSNEPNAYAPPTATAALAPAGPTWAACPKCQASNAVPVSFTWWGGALGPKLLSVVRCLDCQTQFNGKTGQLNTKAIALYMIVVSLIALPLGYYFGMMLGRR